MTPPTPAAVRCALTQPKFEGVTIEEAEALAGDPRTGGDILRDHIRAVAQEMRATIPRNDTDLTMCGMLIRDLLNGFADKLEGLK